MKFDEIIDERHKGYLGLKIPALDLVRIGWEAIGGGVWEIFTRIEDKDIG